MGVGHAGSINLALAAQPPYDDSYGNLKGIMVLYTGAAQHFIIDAGTGLTSFEDIKEKQYPLRLNRNVADSFMDICGRLTLEAYGITDEDLISWGGSVDFMSMNPSFDLMRDGRLDAYFNLIQIPSSHIVDLATTQDVVMFPLSEQVIEELNRKVGTTRAVIPAGTYDFLTEDYPTVADNLILYTHDDVPEDVIYSVLTAVYNNFDFFKGIHASLKDLTLEDMAAVGVPLHPGAEKFYREHGVID